MRNIPASSPKKPINITLIITLILVTNIGGDKVFWKRGERIEKYENIKELGFDFKKGIAFFAVETDKYRFSARVKHVNNIYQLENLPSEFIVERKERPLNIMFHFFEPVDIVLIDDRLQIERRQENEISVVNTEVMG